MGDLRGQFANNRRREISAVTGTLPYVLESADIREATAEVVATNEAYTLVTLPAGILVTGVTLIRETGNTFVAGTCTVTIGSTTVIPAATTLVTAGKTVSTTTPIVLETATDVVITPASLTVNALNVKAKAIVVIEYVDYNRATMSYIGNK